jgi:DNA polymerase I-like protein with 3'-5' exonuclease and polymerase domains
MVNLANYLVEFDTEDPLEEFAKDRSWKPWMEDVSFYCLNDMDAVKAYLEKGVENFSYIAVDTETTGLNVRKVQLVGFSFSYQDNECAYVPLRHTSGTNVDYNEFIKYFKSLIPRTQFIWYNAKYDTEVLHFKGIDMYASEGHFKDAMLNVCLHDSNRAEMNAGLKGASKNYLHREMISFKDVCPHAKGDSDEVDLFPSVDLTLATLYAGSDALNTRDLYEKFRYVEKSQKIIYDLETQLIDVVREMERNGVRIDVKHFKILEKRIYSYINRVKKEIFDLCKKPLDSFNLDSPTQVGKVFFEELNIPNPYKTETGKYKTSADVMEALADETGHPILLKYKDYKKKQKLLNSYITPFIQDDNLDLAYIPFKQFTKATGRFAGGGGGKGSHYLPINVQSIPSVNPSPKKGIKVIDTSQPLKEDHFYYEHLFEWDDQLLCSGKCGECPFNKTCVREEKEVVFCESGYNIRRGFVSSSPDKQIFTIDFSGVELRMVANISSEPKWIDEFLNGEGDLHVVTAMDIFGIEDRRKVIKKQRGLGKTVNFGSLYGGGPGTLVRTVNKDSKKDDHITKEFAKSVLENFWSGIPIVDKWRHKVWQIARTTGVATTHLGRVRPIPEALVRVSKDSTDEERRDANWLNAKGDRNSANHVVQGSSADLMKLAMLRCSRRIKRNKWEDKVKILLTVHDELVFEADKSIVQEAMKQMSECMEVDFPEFPVPFTTDIEYSDRKISNWGMSTECGIVDGKIYPTKLIKEASDRGVGVHALAVSMGKEVEVCESLSDSIVIEETSISHGDTEEVVSDATEVSIQYNPDKFEEDYIINLSTIPRTKTTLNILKEIVCESRGNDQVLLKFPNNEQIILEGINVNVFSRKCDIYLHSFY